MNMNIEKTVRISLRVPGSRSRRPMSKLVESQKGMLVRVKLVTMKKIMIKVDEDLEEHLELWNRRK